MVLNAIQSCNLFPFTYPYILKSRQDNPLPYFVTVNKKFTHYNWIVHQLIFLLAVILGMLRVSLDCSTIFEKLTVLFFVYFGMDWMVVTWFQKDTCNQLSIFINQLINFEIRNVSSDNLNKEKEIWRKDTTRVIVSAASKVLVCALLNHSVCYSLSCAVFPNVSWNIIPSFVTDNSPDSSVVTILVKRLVVWYYLYVSMRLFTNIPGLNIVVNLLIPTFCLDGTMRFLQRQVNPRSLQNNL